jgi:hypothetical protein
MLNIVKLFCQDKNSKYPLFIYLKVIDFTDTTFLLMKFLLILIFYRLSKQINLYQECFHLIP